MMNSNLWIVMAFWLLPAMVFAQIVVEQEQIKPSHVTEEGVPVFTNQSFSPKNQTAPSRDVYRALQDTCRNWTRRFKQDASERNRVHMNQSCRYAADYAREELHIDPGKVSHADYQLKPRTGGTVTAINTGNNHPQCLNWRKKIDVINSRLRAGYSSDSFGNKQRAKRKHYSDLIYRNCR